MAKLALYQKYRSTNFDEVVGQEYVVRSIRNAVRENKTGHAYLFCGLRGTGKTTMARLLAKAVNCENPESAPCGHCENCKAAINGTHPDIVEINAANETHVEDIRDLIDRSQLAPMMGKYKIYIIDEVHQLSSAASSALLKTLEEPPQNVIFILATTDPQKLLPTIISRCQRFDFTKLKKDQIRDHLLDISEKENIQMESDAADMIAELSDGGMRDALSIMDQCASYTSDKITVDAIDMIYGLTSTDEKVDLLIDIFRKDISSVLNRVNQYKQRGIDFARFTDGLIDVLKETVIYKSTKNEELLKIINPEQARRIFEYADLSTCMNAADIFLNTKERFRVSTNTATCFEITCLKLSVSDMEKPSVPDKSEKTAVPEKTYDTVAVKTETPVSTPSASAIPETEKKAELPKENIRVLNEDEILSVLVQCNKTFKTTDENTFAMLPSYSSVENRKYINLLSDMRIAASGENIILLCGKIPAVINRINEANNNEEIYWFLKDTMHTDKVVFAISEEAFRNATSAFVTRRKNGTLPEPMTIQKYLRKEDVQKSSEEKVFDLFGKENVEVM